MNGSQNKGYAMISVLIFMTLLVTLGTGILAATQLSLKTSVAFVDDTKQYYTVESATQLAIDEFMTAVKNGNIVYELFTDEDIGEITVPPPVVSSSAKEAELCADILHKFDTHVRKKLESQTINGLPFTISDVDTTKAIVKHEGVLHVIMVTDPVTGELTDHYAYASHTYLENTNLSFTVSVGGRKIIVETNATTTLRGQKPAIVSKQDVKVGGSIVTDDGKIIGGGILPKGKANNVNYDLLTETPPTIMPAFNNAIKKLVKAQEDKTKSLYITTTPSYPPYPAYTAAVIPAYTGYPASTSRFNVPSSSSLNGFTEPYKEIYNTRTAALTVDLNDTYKKNFSNLEYISTVSPLTLRGPLDKLKYVKSTSGAIIFDGSASHKALQYIDAVGDITIVGSFPELKAVRTKGKITMSNMTGCVKLETLEADGDITATGSFAALKSVRTSAGKITLSNMTGCVKLEKIEADGDITATGSFPALNGIKSAKGKISLTNTGTTCKLSYIEATNVTLSGDFPDLTSVRATNGALNLTNLGNRSKLAYLTSKAALTISGSYPALVGIYNVGTVTFSSNNTYRILEFIEATGDLELFGDFPALKGVYTTGKLVFGDTTSNNPYTSIGTNKPNMYGNSVDIYKLSGKTTQILNATVYAKTTLRCLADFDINAITIGGYDGRNSGKFSSNSVFIASGDITVQAANSFWDPTYAPQFYTTAKMTLNRELLPTVGSAADDLLKILGVKYNVPPVSGIFGATGGTITADSITDKGKVSIQGYIINTDMPDTTKVTKLNETQLGKVDSDILAAMKMLSDKGIFSSGTSTTIQEIHVDDVGDSGTLEVSATGITFREITGG